MKKAILTYLLLFYGCLLFAQKQANIWYFGNAIGLDFNQTPPRALTNTGLANSVEGGSSISDNNGKILFYTNGLTVVNRKHEIMLNGTGLHGDKSSTNNTVVVPLPGNDSVYYLFTTSAALQENQNLEYNIIDMRNDGGFGEVVGKNYVVEDLVFEKLAAVKHCNNKDSWVLVHKWGTDEYHAYLVTSAGLNPTPVISHTGIVINGYENNAIGCLKFSSKGNKLVSIHAFEKNNIELMDFDNTTGVISNPLLFNPTDFSRNPSNAGVYGAEFSPDGKLLYVSATYSQADLCILYQFDITSNNAATILASRQIIHRNSSWAAGALQLAPDLKIYMAMWTDTAISVIDKPDIAGAGCNFQYEKIHMGPKAKVPIQFGLPTFIGSYFDTTASPYDFSRVGNCLDRTVTFRINRLSGIDSVKWDFGDSQQSQVLQPTHTYVSPGFYDVRLIVYKVDCSGLYDTITRKIWIADKADFLGNDTSSCDASISLDIGIPEVYGVNYLWNTGFTGSRITTSGFGIYWLEVEQNGCRLRDSISVSQKPVPLVDLGPDTSICAYKPVVLYSGSTTADSYVWNTGESTPSITINKTGTYYVTVTRGGCTASDTVVVTSGDCEVFIPSAFTPNNDSKNEKFGVITDASVTNFSMQIFNKWGQLVFNSANISEKWDGTFKGKNAPNGAYIWILFYVNKKGERKYQQGTVMLIR